MEILWGKQIFKLLGINFNADLTKMMEQNYTQNIRALENMVKKVGKKKPDTIGKNNSNKGTIYSYLLSITSLSAKIKK